MLALSSDLSDEDEVQLEESLVAQLGATDASSLNDNARRAAFAEHVGTWLVSGQRRGELLGVLQSHSEPFRPQDKAALVRELLTAENSLPADQHADRAEALETARSMRGDSADADALVAQRLNDLRGTGNEDDNAVLEILDERRDRSSS